MKSLESYSIFTKPKLSNPVSWEDMKEFNTHMKEVVRDYKIRQAKARESAKKVNTNLARQKSSRGLLAFMLISRSLSLRSYNRQAELENC